MTQRQTEYNGIQLGEKVKAKSQMGFTIVGTLEAVYQGSVGCTVIVKGARSGKKINVKSGTVSRL